MKKILHILNNDHDGIAHFVKKLIKLSLNNHQNIIISKYSKANNKYFRNWKKFKGFYYSIL